MKHFLKSTIPLSNTAVLIFHYHVAIYNHHVTLLTTRLKFFTYKIQPYTDYQIFTKLPLLLSLRIFKLTQVFSIRVHLDYHYIHKKLAPIKKRNE